MKEVVTFTQGKGIIDRISFLKKVASSNLPVTRNNKGVYYYNLPSAFDIETSSFYQKDEKKACMYIWQFGLMNWVTCGRTWDEFLSFMEILSDVLGLGSNNRLVVYVHNFAYEWQFIRKLIKWDKVFFLEERKPVYAIWGGIEFRCSLKLSSKSLENVGKDLVKYKEYKHIGDLDYQLNRFHSTPLTQEELDYCEADIRVLLAYIQEKIEKDGSICYIPLTNTGYVRKHCRKKCFRKYKDYKALMDELTLEPDEYSQLKRAFSGGFVHASAKYVVKGRESTLERVGSFDFISSYPAEMLLKKFPMSKAKEITKIESWDEFQYYLHNYCCLFDVTVFNVRPKVNFDHIISLSKVIQPENVEDRKRFRKSLIIDNGRIVEAKELSMTMTEQDWFNFCDFYDFGDKSTPDDDYIIHKFRIYEKGYLPRPFYEAILDLYEEKTKLKDVEGEEINYMISKNMLNSAYGMIVTDIVRDELGYDYERNEYVEKKKPDLREAIDKYNKSRKRFLFYPWGVWVTAYSRRCLFSGILSCGDDYVYSDTDSIKVLNPEKHMDYIEDYNNQILKDIKEASSFFGFKEERYSPENKYGEPKTIGMWEFEGIYRKFKTIGAKRYLVEDEKGRIKITVSGLHKQKAVEYLKTFEDPFNAFSHELRVPAEYSGRLTLTYKDEDCDGYEYDYLGNLCEFHEKSYIHMEPSDYRITMSEEYLAFLNYILGVKEYSW